MSQRVQGRWHAAARAPANLSRRPPARRPRSGAASAGDVLVVRGSGFGASPRALFGPYDGDEAVPVAPCDDASPLDRCVQLTVPRGRRRALEAAAGLSTGGNDRIPLPAIASVDDDGVIVTWGAARTPVYFAVPRVTECRRVGSKGRR